LPDIGERRRLGLEVVRFLSARMLDPHLYFEAKYTKLIERAETPGELDTILDGLLEWAAGSGLGDDEFEHLNRRLRQAGLPPLEPRGRC